MSAVVEAGGVGATIVFRRVARAIIDKSWARFFGAERAREERRRSSSKVAASWLTAMGYQQAPRRPMGATRVLPGKRTSAGPQSAVPPSRRFKRALTPLSRLFAPHHLPLSTPPAMMLTTLLAPLLLLPYASAAVHKMQLKKMPQPAAFNPETEAAHLAYKYGAAQVPISSSFAAPSRFAPRPGKDANGEDLFWTQDALKGGHSVPLNSAPTFPSVVLLCHTVLTLPLDYMNAQYYSEITIGNPPQTVRTIPRLVVPKHS